MHRIPVEVREKEWDGNEEARGRGGRSMGIGRGMYVYPSQPPMMTPQPGGTNREQEVEALTRQLKELEGRLEEVKRGLEELKGAMP